MTDLVLNIGDVVCLKSGSRPPAPCPFTGMAPETWEVVQYFSQHRLYYTLGRGGKLIQRDGPPIRAELVGGDTLVKVYLPWRTRPYYHELPFRLNTWDGIDLGFTFNHTFTGE